jgi:hypothetical protein
MRDTEKAFNWIINIIEQKGISYRISGGFAARIHGVNRELADIDIEVDDKNISLIAKDVAPYIVFGPAKYRDENWDLNLMTLQYLGQEIDIASTNAKIFNQKTKLWEKWVTKLGDVEIKEIFNKKVPVEPISSLIYYKTNLARDVDLEDVKQLKIIVAKNTKTK